MRSHAKNPLSIKRPSLAVLSRATAAAVDEQARLNVSIPASLHAKVKAHVATRRISIRDYVIELFAKEGLKE